MQVVHPVRFPVRVHLLSLTLCFPLISASAQRGEDAGTYTTRIFHWENDFKITDEQYTNGLRYAWSTLKPASIHFSERAPLWIWIIDLLPFSFDELLPPCLGGRQEVERCWEWASGGTIGQNFYTPEDIGSPFLIPDDRPYAGWLYFGSSIQWSKIKPRVKQHYAELDLGLVGPFSFSDQVQRLWHEQIDSPEPRGWRFQVERTPGVVLRYLYRAQAFSPIDLIPSVAEFDLSGHAGGAVGNVFNQGNAGIELRLGKNLGPDFAQLPIVPTINFVQDARPVRYQVYAFGRVDGRGVVSNFLLEGSSVHEIEKKVGVLDFNFGVSARYDWIQITVQHVTRSPEFRPGGYWHNFNSFSLTLLPKELLDTR